MNAKSYLSRIGYDGPTDPSAQTLAELHRAHVLSVPFENLDIHLGRRILIDPDAFYDKIVTEGGERRETAVDDLEEYLQLLRRHFGIDLDGAVWRSPP